MAALTDRQKTPDRNGLGPLIDLTADVGYCKLKIGRQSSQATSFGLGG